MKTIPRVGGAPAPVFTFFDFTGDSAKRNQDWAVSAADGLQGYGYGDAGNGAEPDQRLRAETYRRKNFVVAAPHENSCQAKPAKGESRGKHIRTENTER